ncbi:MAG: S1C family serine protease [bacterium]|nr:S1C family serine protease [bacterium]
MLTSRSLTARCSALVAALAVIFSLSATATASETDQPLVTLESSLTDLIFRVSPAVVTVQAEFTTVRTPASAYLGSEPFRSRISSGIVVDSSGHILVSASSVAGSQAIYVRFPSQKTVPARLVGIDYPSSLALLETKPGLGVPPPITQQCFCGGQMVLTVGNSYGLRISPSLGFCAGVRADGLIQFSSMMTSGTIGGGLFDLSGNLLGIISGGLSSGNRIEAGLAVPAGRVSEIIEYLQKFGDRPTGYLGLSTREIEMSPGLSPQPSGAVVKAAGRKTIDHGLLVTSVDKNAPAARSGLRPGDLIYAVNQRDIYSASDFQLQVRNSAPGTRFQIEFLRNRRSYAITVPVSAHTQVNSSQVSGNALHQPDPTANDSLRQELESLKEAVRRLELRLNEDY